MSQGFASDPILGDGGRNPFVHPADGEIMDEPILCHECHDGALGLGGRIEDFGVSGDGSSH
jgi:hypothetical protein